MSEREPEIAQVQFVGKPFERKVKGGGENQEDPVQTRRVRIIGGYRPGTGTIFFRAAGDCPLEVSGFPHLPLSGARSMHDQADASRSLSTARKGGASSPGTDVEKVWRQRGGQGIRIPHQGGFFSPQQQKAIDKLRRKRGATIASKRDLG